MRRHWRALALIIGVLVVSGLGYRAFEDWRFRSDLEDARVSLVRARYPEAESKLLALVMRRPSDGEALYRLGVCESSLGRSDRAREAWSKVPEGSPFLGRASVELARFELKRHHLAEAEDLMTKALVDEGSHALEAVETLLSLYKIEGRFDEASRLVRSSAGRYPDKIGVLKEIAQLVSSNPFKLDLARSGLERASSSAPEDDRVWLGWANLAIRTGQFDEAAKWLDRCQKRRGEDSAVWKSRLGLARAQQDPELAWLALSHLNASSLEPAEILSLRAWFASISGDESVERKALNERLAIEPADLLSLDRLAELELKAGRAAEAEKLRTRKANLDRIKAEYEVILFLPDASERSAQLAKLADALDRRQEAQILWTMAVRQRPGDPEPPLALARLEKATVPSPPTDATLPALLASRSLLKTGSKVARTTIRSGAALPNFVDAAETSGLIFTFDNGIDPLRHLPETMSGGLAVLDYDGDGWLDVYCVQGGSFLPDSSKPTGGDRLFRNKGQGQFEDVTDRSGIGGLPRGYGHGVTVGDFDNDGHPDLFLTRWDAYALFRNRGDGTFEDFTERAGLGGPRDWPSSAAFADLDNDGDLDLYVCHYLDWDVANPQVCLHPTRQTPVFCGPPKFKSKPDHLFRNDGGRFVDVTAEAGIVDTHGHGLGVLACDFDGDGKVDIFVTNDQSANFLFRNLGGMRFEEIGEVSGVGSSAEGHYQANMGIACGDVDGDGSPDLAVTEFYNEGTALYLNLGKNAFSDHSSGAGLKVATRYLLGFGTAFLDFDSDGYLDLATTNGHVDDFRPAEPYQMPAQLLAGTASGKFVDVTASAGGVWQVPRLGRGLVAADLDNDGRTDLLILAQNQPLAYLRNQTEGGRWLTLELQGSGSGSNRDAVGARVVLTAGGRSRSAWRFGGGSYQSASDPRVHFGLGRIDQPERLEVIWPSGRTESFEGVEANHGYRLREGTGRAEPLPGFTR